jgi:hypothetical protein
MWGTGRTRSGTGATEASGALDRSRRGAVDSEVSVHALFIGRSWRRGYSPSAAVLYGEIMR